MTQSQHWRLAITPLSPVHMGTGQDYEPTGYVIDNGALYEFDGVAALQALPVPERERLGHILDRRPGQDMLREVQSFFHKNRERLIAVSRHQVRVNSSIEAFYGERVGQVVQHEQGGKRVQNKLEIERTAYTSTTGAAILPGSGLKGAIRTALLDAVNEGRPLSASLKGDRQANSTLQEQLFKGNFHTDPLRLIRLGDAGLSNPEDFSTEIRFALNRKKQPVRKDGVLIQSQAEQHGLYQLLECLPALQARAFEGSLSIQGTEGVESQHWPKPDMRFRLPQIAVACNRFYRSKLDDELKLLRKRGYLDVDWGQRLQTLLDGPVGQSLDTNSAFLLRVGRHSGAESVTLDGLRSIKIIKGRGERPDYLDHTKTLWLAGDERQIQTNLQPFGWLLLEPFEEVSQLPPWQEAAGNPVIVAWRTDVRARQAEKAAKLEYERQREVEQKQAEEKAEREAAARKEQLESLSEEGRKIAGLRELLVKDKAANRKQAGGELASSLVALLKQAEENWQGQECAELVDLALEIYGFLGWPASKKKRQRKAQIEAIRKKAEYE